MCNLLFVFMGKLPVLILITVYTVRYIFYLYFLLCSCFISSFSLFFYVLLETKEAEIHEAGWG